MTVSVGDKMPGANPLTIGPEGPTSIDLAERVKGKKVVIFGLPGPFTRTCSAAHLPSFVRNMDGLKAKGVDEVMCLAVADPFVMQAWGEQAGAIDAGITMLADWDSSFTKAMGRAFDAPPVGFIQRSTRYSMIVEDGVITAINEESSPGECDISAAETLIDAM